MLSHGSRNTSSYCRPGSSVPTLGNGHVGSRLDMKKTHIKGPAQTLQSALTQWEFKELLEKLKEQSE